MGTWSSQATPRVFLRSRVSLVTHHHLHLRLHLQPTTPINISTRYGSADGRQVLIGGFIITGNDPKMVLFRAIGPSLADAFGIDNLLADPVLELHNG